jgi:hypothetical protein
MTAVLTTDLDDRISKNIPVMQIDRTVDRMKTFVMNRKTVNPIYLKRTICEDKISTVPLSVNGTFI